MKILHVEAGRNLYGGALQVVYLIRGLADRGVENLLVCPPGSAIEQAGREAGAVVHPVAMGGDLDLLLPVRLRRIIRTQRPDLVHLHSRRGADVLGGLAARWSQTPCVHSRRVDNPEFPFVARWKYRLFDRIVTISEGIRDVLLAEGVPGDRVVCVRSAIDTAAYDCSGETPWFRKEFDLKEGDRAVGMIAQFIRRKGHRDLLNALPAVLEKHPSLRVLLFGKGPLEQEVRRHATRLRLDPAVRFCGFRSDLKRVLPCLDALVHPAYMEGLGVSLLQAAASCVPIIATSVGGIPEIVHDGENGVLVPPGRTDRMAEALARLLSDPAGARAMGHAGRSMIKRNFSLEQMVTGNLRVYETVLRRQGGAFETLRGRCNGRNPCGMKERMSSTKKNLPAVFLDRDGTVIEEVEYLSDLGAIRPFPGSAEAFQTLREAGFQIVLVSNQSGVARGYFDENFVREANERIQQMLEFRFDGVYYCPHGPDDECACRKPATGLVDRAVGEMGLQRSGSFMIGDKGADIGLARASGLQAILVRTGYGKEFEGRVSADYVADDLSSACRWILSSNRKQSGR